MNTKLVTALLAITSITTVTLFVFVIFFQQASLQNDDVLFQDSSLDSLLKGAYEGKMTVHDLLNHGNFGLGAVEYMDGELVCLDAECYRISTDGMAHKLSPESTIAFGTVVFFQSNKTTDIPKQQNFTELQRYLDDKIIEKNNIFAIKINGFFNDITTRSVHKQDRLYVHLSDIVANQTVSHFSNVQGTLVGFYIPDYMKEINVKGYHFHFLTMDREFGGHVLDLNMTNGTMQILKLDEVHMIP
jgi:acetolactate decarboxylase